MAVQGQKLYPENLDNLSMCGLQMQQDWVVNNHAPVSSAAIDTDLCFSFQEHHHHQHHFLFAQQNPNKKLGFDCNRGASSSSSTCDTNIFSSMAAALPQSLHAQLELQGQELGCILNVQSERLRSALQEQRNQQLGLLLKSVESKAMNMMRQKEEDLAQATKKAMELEVCLRKAEMEMESWQRLARANEVMVMDLSNTLEQVKERMVIVSSNRIEDAESFCCGSCDDDDNKEQELKEAESKKIACSHCNSRNSCVLFLPCRHLCSCKQCGAFLDYCPVCKSAKEASMEVLWF